MNRPEKDPKDPKKNTPKNTPGNARELRFTVWQFVRLMVHLEETSKRSRDQEALFTAWSDVWTPLDQDLAHLGASDADAYSDMMMDQDVVIEDATAEQAATAKVVLQAVIETMDTAIKSERDQKLLDSLTFERRELHTLVRKLGRRDQA
jgi:hypothetical protein